MGVGSNQLSNIDVSNNVNLERFYCYQNPIPSINVTNNIKLTTLSSWENQLTNLDVSQNAKLNYLYCHANQLTSLDVSNNSVLIELWANDNQLTSLNVKNGNNTAITHLDAINNSSLSCIDVDNPVAADGGLNNYANWSKDATANYALDCSASLGVEDKIISFIEVYPNPADNTISLKPQNEISKIEVFNLYGSKVKEFNSNFSNLTISNLSSGVYILRIHSVKGIFIKKLIKK